MPTVPQTFAVEERTLAGSVASEWAGGCHGSLSRFWFPSAIRPRSGRMCECRPSCCEPEGTRKLGGQRRERMTEVLHHRMPAREHVGRTQLLEPAHRPQALLEVAVITLQAIVEVVRRAVLHRRQDGPECRRVAAGLVSRDPLGGRCPSRAWRARRTAEPQRRCAAR
jgi:hypothetical protein